MPSLFDRHIDAIVDQTRHSRFTAVGHVARLAVAPQRVVRDQNQKALGSRAQEVIAREHVLDERPQASAARIPTTTAAVRVTGEYRDGAHEPHFLGEAQVRGQVQLVLGRRRPSPQPTQHVPEHTQHPGFHDRSRGNDVLRRNGAAGPTVFRYDFGISRDNKNRVQRQRAFGKRDVSVSTGAEKNTREIKKKKIKDATFQLPTERHTNTGKLYSRSWERER